MKTDYTKITPMLALALSESDGPFSVIVTLKEDAVASFLVESKEEISELSQVDDIVLIDISKRVEVRRWADR